MDEGNRPRALSLLTEHVQSESLLKHAYAVEAAMRRMARYFHQNEDFWGVAGLLHDLEMCIRDRSNPAFCLFRLVFLERKPKIPNPVKRRRYRR